jgi:threonine dehydratase
MYLDGWIQVFSFKLRGAYNMMAKLPREQLDRGVICSSAGNHAQGVALAAHRLKCDAVIAMPITTPKIKVSCRSSSLSQCVFANAQSLSLIYLSEIGVRPYFFYCEPCSGSQ